MRRFYIVFLFSLLYKFGVCQNTATASLDTIFMNNEKIACNVKEVTEDAVKYVYPGEETINTVYKNAIQKIVFRSGRVSVFTESSSLKTVSCVDDYDNVSFSQVESEVKGLYKLGEVSSKARGVTVFADMERVKERAIFKLKVQAAMMGANVIYLTQEWTTKNHYSEYGSSATATNMAGVAYSNVIPDYNNFTKKINQRTDFKITQEVELPNSSFDYSEKQVDEKFHINKITNENGFIMISGKIDNESDDTFRVISFTDNYFIIATSNEDSSYNFKVNY